MPTIPTPPPPQGAGGRRDDRDPQQPDCSRAGGGQQCQRSATRPQLPSDRPLSPHPRQVPARLSWRQAGTPRPPAPAQPTSQPICQKLALPEPPASLPGDGAQAGRAAQRAPEPGPREELPSAARGPGGPAPPPPPQDTAEHSPRRDGEKARTHLEKLPEGWGPRWQTGPEAPSGVLKISLWQKALPSTECGLSTFPPSLSPWESPGSSRRD